MTMRNFLTFLVVLLYGIAGLLCSWHMGNVEWWWVSCVITFMFWLVFIFEHRPSNEGAATFVLYIIIHFISIISLSAGYLPKT